MSECSVRPEESTVAGLDDVRQAVGSARRVFLVTDPEALTPQRMTKRELRRFLAGIRERPGVSPVVVTARVYGKDLVVRTLQWIGDGVEARQAGDSACGRGPRAVSFRCSLCSRAP